MFAQLMGARTYIIAVLLALVGVWMSVDELVNFLGVADLPDVPAGLLAILGGGAAATLRAGISNAEHER
jgi:hypothetical protein